MEFFAELFELLVGDGPGVVRVNRVEELVHFRLDADLRLLVPFLELVVRHLVRAAVCLPCPTPRVTSSPHHPVTPHELAERHSLIKVEAHAPAGGIGVPKLTMKAAVGRGGSPPREWVARNHQRRAGHQRPRPPPPRHSTGSMHTRTLVEAQASDEACGAHLI